MVHWAVTRSFPSSISNYPHLLPSVAIISGKDPLSTLSDGKMMCLAIDLNQDSSLLFSKTNHILFNFFKFFQILSNKVKPRIKFAQ
jgi:hypothetical protein